MMCCNRCGDILSSDKCRKCGGRPVASIIASSGLNSPTIRKEASIKIADKWQSQYANGILGSQHTVFDAKEHQPPVIVQSTTSTPLRSTTKRHSIPEGFLNGSTTRKQQNPLSLSLQNTCTNCDKRLVYDAPSFIESGSHYCKECHISLFSKGPCSKCKNPVFHQRDAFIEHDTQVWHKDCFRCHNCFVTLGHAPMVDLNGRPCCERCLIAQSGEAKQAKLSYPSPATSLSDGGDSTPASTPGLRDTISSAGSSYWLPRTPPPTNSRPRIDSVLFNHYQKTLQNDQQQQPPIAPPLTPSSLSPAGSIRSSASGSPVSISSISPSPSPLSHGSSASSSSSTRSDLSSSPPPPSVAEAATAAQRRLSQHQQQKPQPQQRKLLNKRSSIPTSSPSLSSRPKETNTTKKPSSDLAKKACTGCNKVIQGSKVKLQSYNGDIYFHHDCLICSGCQCRFPDSRCVLKNNKVYHPKCQPLSSSEFMDEQRHQYQCYNCKKSIKERSYTVGSRSYHPECFQCYQCHTVLPKEFYEAFNEPHCESCIHNTDPDHYNNNYNSTHRRSSMQTPPKPKTQAQSPPPPAPTRMLHRNRPSSSTSTPLLSSQRSLDHPSSVLMHRTRALPKLGGAKTCPRCHTSIGVMEEAQGPKATKWHKRCLRCAGCSKQMDSMARMSEDADGKWLVHCRGCMDKTGSKNNFVR